MEDFQRFAEDFAKCVKYHVNNWYEKANYEYTHFHDVEAYVTAELEVNESLHRRLTDVSTKSQIARTEMEADVAKIQAETKAMREAYALQARPLLVKYDEISLSKHYYSEILNLVGNQEYITSQLQSRETTNYGYQSKRLISLSLTLEALKHHMRNGKPFSRELTSLVEDSESPDVAIVSAPLQQVAPFGLASVIDIRTSAYALARAMEDSVRWNSVNTAKTWFDNFKFRTVTQPGITQAEKMQVAIARDAAKLFLSHVDSGDWARAVQLVDKSFESMTTANTTASGAYAASLQQFKQLALPHVAAEQFLEFADASMVSAQVAFVEDILKIR